MPVKHSSAPIVMKITGIGPVPSFKNTKSIFRRKDGTPFIATNPRMKKWMDQATRSLRSQLLSLSQTTAGAMQTECCPPALTALLKHSTDFDDSIQWIPEITIKVRQVDKGREGAEIIIEKL